MTSDRAKSDLEGDGALYHDSDPSRCTPVHGRTSAVDGLGRASCDPFRRRLGDARQKKGEEGGGAGPAKRGAIFCSR